MSCKDKIVTKGCSGNCCEKFTLPVTIKDLFKMKLSFIEQRLESAEKETYINNVTLNSVICDNGYKRYPAPEEDVDKLLEMLIYLGRTNICPQSEIPFDRLYYKQIISKNDEELLLSSNGHFIINNGNIEANIYTCKHFDKEKRICTNYNNRPQLCKSFGNECHYKGCNYKDRVESISNGECIKHSIEDISNYDENIFKSL